MKAEKPKSSPRPEGPRNEFFKTQGKIPVVFWRQEWEFFCPRDIKSYGPDKGRIYLSRDLGTTGKKLPGQEERKTDIPPDGIHRSGGRRQDLCPLIKFFLI